MKEQGKGDGPKRTINVVRTYAAMESYMSGFSEGHFPFVVLIGSWGTGKSRLVKQSLGENAGWIEGITTSFGLYSLFHRYIDRPIVLDDLDGIYADKLSVCMLKAMCRAETVKRIGWNARNGFLEREGLPKEFETRSPVMIICNEWKTVNKNVAALEDRALIVHFTPSREEIHERAATWFPDEEIYKWFGENLHRIETHSFRYYVKAAQLKAAGIPWRRLAVGESTREQREILAEELIYDNSFAGNEDRARAFVRRGGGSRATFFNYRRKILGP